MQRRCLAGVAAFLCVLAWPAWAAADEVLLLHLGDPGSRALAERARTEIALVRLGAVLRETAPLDDAGLERVAIDARERAVVWLRDLDDQTAEAVVWIFPAEHADDARPHTQSSRPPARGQPEVHRVRASGADRAAILALRLAELLDTRLRESTPPAVQEAPPVERSPSPRPARPPVWTAKRERARVGVGFASGLFHGFDGVGPAVTPSLGVVWRPSARADLGVWLSGPARGLTIHTEHGDIVTTEALVLGSAVVHLTSGAVTPTLALGAGAHFLHAKAEPRGTGVGHGLSHWSAAIASGPGLAWRISPAFDVFLDASAVMVLRRPVLSVASEPVASAGRPSLLVRLGLEWLP